MAVCAAENTRPLQNVPISAAQRDYAATVGQVKSAMPIPVGFIVPIYRWWHRTCCCTESGSKCTVVPLVMAERVLWYQEPMELEFSEIIAESNTNEGF
eukprot:954927-Rhodomonas_salina.1